MLADISQALVLFITQKRLKAAIVFKKQRNSLQKHIEMLYFTYNRETSLRWKIRVATHQQWLTRDARAGTLAKGANLLTMNKGILY